MTLFFFVIKDVVVALDGCSSCKSAVGFFICFAADCKSDFFFSSRGYNEHY